MPIAERDYDRQALPKVDLRRPLDYSQPSNKTAIVVGALDKGIQAGIQGYQTYARHKQANFNKEVSLHQKAMQDEFGEVVGHATQEQLLDKKWLAGEAQKIVHKRLGTGRSANDFAHDLVLLGEDSLRDQKSSYLRQEIRGKEGFWKYISNWRRAEARARETGHEPVPLKDVILSRLKGPLLESFKKSYPKTYESRALEMTLEEAGYIALSSGNKKAYGATVDVAQKLVEDGALTESGLDRVRSRLAERSEALRKNRKLLSMAEASADRENLENHMLRGAKAMSAGDWRAGHASFRAAVNQADTVEAVQNVYDHFRKVGLFRNTAFLQGILAEWSSGKIRGEEAYAKAVRMGRSLSIDPNVLESSLKDFKTTVMGKRPNTRVRTQMAAKYTVRGRRDPTSEAVTTAAFERAGDEAREFWKEFKGETDPLALDTWRDREAVRLGELRIVSEVLGLRYEDVLSVWYDKKNPLKDQLITPEGARKQVIEVMKNPRAYRNQTNNSATQDDIDAMKDIVIEWIERLKGSGRGTASGGAEKETFSPITDWNQL